MISGAASGIGRATAELFAREGARVMLADRDAAGVRAAAEAIQRDAGQVAAAVLDVSSEPDWHAAVRATMDMWGALDVLVTAAGISFAAPIVEMTLDDWRRVMAVNLDGTFLGMKHAARAMRAGRGGSMVLVSSASGVRGGATASAYCASKAAVCLLARCAALEFGPETPRIRVNTVLPGAVKTPMWRSMEFFQELVRQQGSEEKAFAAVAADAPLRRAAEPQEVAEAILYLASDAAAFVTGTELVIDGGWSA